MQVVHSCTHYFERRGRHGIGALGGGGALPAPCTCLLPFGTECPATSVHAHVTPDRSSSFCTAAKAIMVVVFELTLLGLFGLILEAFSTPISHVCGEAPASGPAAS